jgi:phage gpG-like protein
MDAASSFPIWTINREEAFVSALPADTTYGYIHEFGATAIPARPFFIIQEEDASKIEEVFIEWVGEQVLGHGFTPFLGTF